MVPTDERFRAREVTRTGEHLRLVVQLELTPIHRLAELRLE